HRRGPAPLPPRAADPRLPRAPQHRAPPGRRRDSGWPALPRHGVHRRRADRGVLRPAQARHPRAPRTAPRRLRRGAARAPAPRRAPGHQASNILVTDAGEPKLLDFGIAKLLDESASEDPPRTRTGARMLAPEYASPERARGEPVTTASDVHALAAAPLRPSCRRAPPRGQGLSGATAA